MKTYLVRRWVRVREQIAVDATDEDAAIEIANECKDWTVSHDNVVDIEAVEVE